MWLNLIGPVLKFIQWLGTMLVMKKAGRDEERAKNAEAAVETIERVSRPILDAERERLWNENYDKFKRGVQRTPGT